ncbi:MAG: beta-lactamase family protein [Flammeovirgaceae bacterium]|nr:beta-lactamase family protein [Flammeovirgaceae bacterium]
MKNSIYFFLPISLILFISSCNQQNFPEHPAENITHSVSTSYKPPVFIKDNRAEKIKQLAPQIQTLFEDYAKEKHIPGIAYGIVVDDELVVASSTGLKNLENESPTSTNSSFRIASMTKSFTAMAILKLRDEGKLSLNDPVSKFIPEMANLEYLTADAPTIDIENLLTMTAGFPEDNPWGDRQLDESDQMLIDLVKEGTSFSNASSYKFEYSNTGYALLGNIISKISGIPFQSYINENILQPLGMNETYWEIDSVPSERLVIGYRWEDEQWKLEPMLHDGSYGAMGGLITSIEDFSKYVSFHLSAWPPRSEDDLGPVKRSSLREMQTPQFSKLYANAKNFKGDTCALMAGYGFGLGISQYCNGLKRISHGGALPGFGSNYYFFPEYGIGVMAFCNLTYTTPWPFNDIGKLLFDEANLKPRKLPASAILLERQNQITKLIQDWDESLEAEILAENFYMDKSRAHRKAAIEEVFEKAGKISKMGKIKPYNQLRGSFKLIAENGEIDIFFTLSPEKNPKVQQLDVSFQGGEL